MEVFMKATKRTFFCFAVFLILLIASTAFTQDATVTVGSILKNAKVPLTDEQATKIKSFKLGGDFEMFRELGEMFTEKQTAALKEKLGVMQGFEGDEQPAYLFFVVIFENEGCPFTESQIEKMKKIEPGPEGFEEMKAVYTEKQGAVLQEMFSGF
jgi:hypothetical protein